MLRKVSIDGVFILILYSLLLVLFVQFQLSLKFRGVIEMMIGVGIAGVAYLIKKESLITLFFYLFSGLLLLVNYFTLLVRSIELFYPDRAVVWVDGIKHQVMDVSWMYALVISLGLSILTLLLYHKRLKLSPDMEKICTYVFILVVGVVSLYKGIV